MRISDWSSDVCSSDLVEIGDAKLGFQVEAAGLRQQLAELVDRPLPVPGEVRGALAGAGRREDIGGAAARRLGGGEELALIGLADGDVGSREVAQDQGSGQRAHRGGRPGRPIIRSEEHTSELQSLMRISYAVLCL